jgi:acyl-CoA dehydrogenase
MFHAPSDDLGAKVAQILIAPSTDENQARERLTCGMYLPKSEQDVIGALEAALTASIAAEAVEQKLRAAQREHKISGPDHAALVEDAAAKGIIRLEEREVLARFARLRDEVIKVDHFPQDFGLSVTVQERAAA